MAFKPKTLSFAQAATVPMSVETAYQALFTHSLLLPVAGTGAKGKCVFVTGASGAVGMVRSLIIPSYSCSLTYLTKLEDRG